MILGIVVVGWIGRRARKESVVLEDDRAELIASRASDSLE